MDIDYTEEVDLAKDTFDMWHAENISHLLPKHITDKIGDEMRRVHWAVFYAGYIAGSERTVTLLTHGKP